MIQPVLLLVAVAATFLVAHASLGPEVVYRVGYGAFSLMAAMISLTFLWLWARRATPLALGMSLSWAGAASTVGWWWVYHIRSRPDAMVDSGVVFLFFSLYFSGAILHFAVIQRSAGWRRAAFALPVLGALAVATAVQLFV